MSTRGVYESDLTATILGSSVPSERHAVTLATFDAQIAMIDHLLAGLPSERFTCQACGTDVPAESPLCARCGSRYDDASDADGFDGSVASRRGRSPRCPRRVEGAVSRPITRGVYESLGEFEARAPHGEGVCPCCDGYGEVVTRHHAATRDEPASDETDDCDECEGVGTVPCDPGEECDPADAPIWLGATTEAA